MKLKYIFLSILAAAAFATACDDDVEISSLGNFKVSQSYIGFELNGGSITSDVTASDSWSFNTSSIPSWLSVNPTSGSAGTQTITFRAQANEDPSPRSLELKVTVGDNTQIFTVYQEGAGEAPASTIPEVLNGSDGTTYKVSGIVSTVSSTTYGNVYIEDADGNSLYIYGLVNSQGQYPKDASGGWEGFGIDVGDEITVQGPRSTYGSTIELVDATLLSVSKSLIKVTSDPIEFQIEGGSADITVESKGDGIEVSVPEDAKSWLSVSGINTATGVVTIHALPNEEGDRATTLTFLTTSAGVEYTAQQEVTQKGAILEVSIAEFNAAEVGATIYRLTGVVTRIANSKYGNFYIKDWSGETYVYGLSDFASTGIEEHDIITITGTRGVYKETIEVLSATLENRIDVQEISIADFLTKDDSKDVYYAVTGTISSIRSETYGNLYISDGTNELYVYGCYPGYGAVGDNRKNFLATAGIEVGDELTMIGYKTTYGETVELAGGIYFSHEKASSDASAE